MFVMITVPTTIVGYAYASGALAELPREFVNLTKMSRLGPNLTTAQQSAIVPWSTVAPGSPAIDAE